MSFLEVVLMVICIGTIGCILYLGIRLSKARDRVQRSAVKKKITGTLAGLFIVIAAAGIFYMWNPTKAEASSVTGQQKNAANYTLVRDVFNYEESTYVLALHYKNAPIVNVIEWDIISMPSEVSFASISRINGQDILTFAGMPPKTSYYINIQATVMDANVPRVRIPLLVQIIKN